MNSFFQLFFAWGLLLVFILVLYIIDKVNVIYQSYAKPDLPQTYNDGLFGELSGKSLWDAMSGIPVPGVDAKFVGTLKPHYEPVLRQHIEQVFMEGYKHGRRANQQPHDSHAAWFTRVVVAHAPLGQHLPSGCGLCQRQS